MKKGMLVFLAPGLMWRNEKVDTWKFFIMFCSPDSLLSCKWIKHLKTKSKNDV